MRQNAMEILQARVYSHNCSIIGKEGELSFPGIIIVDDIMYLRSMRRQVYVLARESGIPVLVVWVRTELDVALERNAQRTGKGRVPDEVIAKIYSELQPPEEVFIFDRYFLVLENSTLASESIANANVALVISRAQQAWNAALKTASSSQKADSGVIEGDIKSKASLEESVLKLLDVELRLVSCF
jgi:tRNA uridine 5-carbamoylmethylation protein Kti12